MEKNQVKNIIESIRGISDIAKKEGWILTFDKDEGALYYSPEVIPDKAELFQITDEYAVYVDENYKPEGIMIESYSVNFIKHHPEFKELSEEVFGSGKEIIKKINPAKINKNNANVFKSLLEKTLILESIQNPLIVSC